MTWRMIKVDDNIPTITITVEEYIRLRECEAECNYNTPVDKSEVLDKIREEIENIELLAEYTRGDIKRMALAVIDKYKGVEDGSN